MQTPPDLGSGRSIHRGGFALIVVLIALALITALTVFFMSDVGRERRGVDQYSRGSDVRHIADTAINLVQGQINAATKEGKASNPISWASQPGMIRTYGTDGQLSRAYKLYSWDNLVEDGPSVSGGKKFDPIVNTAEELPVSNWARLPSQYTDLNSPVNGSYPIVDPSIANAISDPLTDRSSTGTPLVSGSTVPPWDFPQAFSVITNPAKGYYASTNNALPMPVKWLYILQDGTWISPATANTTGVTFTSGGTAPSLTNPIVGRMAFWTDDETSKVNINTASEGSFWDTPKAATADDLQFAANPPAKGEFQRISGHPATTSLSAVFPELKLNGFSRWASGGGSPNTFHLQEMQDLYNIAPRIDWGSSAAAAVKQLYNNMWGGSQVGTQPVTAYTQTYAPPSGNVKTDGIFLDSDRLYASADDLWFQPGRTMNTAFANATAPLRDTQQTASPMAKRLFLMTSDSRAPETTVFETPRISLWPITWPYNKSAYYINTIVGGLRTTPQKPTSNVTPDPSLLASNNWMTYQERLLAFDSTLNQSATAPDKPLPYYFQRQNPDSPTFDWTNIQRNQELVGYLRREMGQPFPGLGNTGLTLDGGGHWGNANADWIALNCFDFSRSLINQYTYNQNPDNKVAPNNFLSDFSYSYTGIYSPNSYLNNTVGRHIEPNAYSVVPLRVPISGNTYTTEGAFPSLKEVSLVFYATSRVLPQAPSAPADVPDPKKWNNLITFNTGITDGDKSQTTSMRAVMLFGFSGMSPGVYSARGISYFSPVFWIKVTRASGADTFKINGVPINFPVAGNVGHVVQYSTVTGWTGGYMAAMPASLFTIAGAAKTFSTLADVPSTWNKSNNWSLISDEIGAPCGITPDKTQFAFAGSKIQVDIYAPDPSGNLNIDPTANPELLISSQQVDFSAWDCPTAARLTPLPIPIAPRWNVKQAASEQTPSFAASFDNASGSEKTRGWKTELVPAIGILGGQTPVASPPDPRNNTSYSLISTTSGVEPLIYAFASDSAGTNLCSPVFQNRVNYLKPGGSSTTPPLAAGTSASLFYGYSQPGVPVQAYQLITPYDTVIGMVSDPNSSMAGDARLIGRGNLTSLGSTGATPFVAYDRAIQNVNGTTKLPQSVVFNLVNGVMFGRSTDKWQHHSLSTILGQRFPTGYWLPYLFGDDPSPNPTSYKEIGSYGSYTQVSAYPASGGYLLGRASGDAAIGVDTNVTNTISSAWDWTALPGNFADGGYINRPDEDYELMNPGTYGAMKVPYYNDLSISTTSSTGTNLTLNAFSPNRQVPSPVILGTLPSSISIGWQTLNFCPNPAKAMNTVAGGHPGLASQNVPSATGSPYYTLPDHLLLDLFWMPVAEPYPISDQLSTAGKVNLNYTMMPFPYIQRKTALNAVLKSVSLAALPKPKDVPNFSKYYKSYGLLFNTGRLDQTRTRFPVNVDATLKAFDYKFSRGDIFRSASQICDVFLYPNSATATDQLPASNLVLDNPPATTSIVSWWKDHSLTADNVREDPYNSIYSRITTKSNTFTVHWKVQSLTKRSGSVPTTWTENSDSVNSELRGSTLIERYIDPNATNIPDYATDTTHTAQPLSQFYKWRTVSENYFRP